MSITTHVNQSNVRHYELTTYDKINYSPAQAKYTFGKAGRFPSLKNNCPVVGYDLPRVLNQRAAGFGFGDKKLYKAQQREKRHNPSPDKYSLTSPFDPKELEIGTFGKPKKSFCFGAGREDFSKTVYNASNLSPDPEIPGPGQYSDKTMTTGYNGRKTTLKERKFYLDDEEMAKKIANPGPGQYNDQQAMHKDGLYISSQMVNSKAAKINTGRRFKTYATIVPGPGTYEEAGMVANGIQVCSRFHSPLVKNLKTSSPRSRWGENPRFRTPGPGSYRPPSDFGYLQPKSSLVKRSVRGYQGYGSLFSNTEQSKEQTIEGDDVAQLQIGKIDSIAISVQSDKKRHRRNQSQSKTVEVTDYGHVNNRVSIKKPSAGGDRADPFTATQNSTFYSINQSTGQDIGQSIESPSDPNVTPMGKGGYASDMNSPELRKSPLRLRETQTPNMKGVAPRQLQKFKIAAKQNHNMKDMVFIYADMGPRIRQKTFAKMQQKTNLNVRGEVEVEKERALASEMGHKPNSGSGSIVNTKKQATSAFEQQ